MRSMREWLFVATVTITIDGKSMSKEQLDAIKVQLLAEENDGLRKSIFSAYLEEPQRGAHLIIAFANDKGFKLDATAEEIVNYINALDDSDISIELSPEMLASVSGGSKISSAISSAKKKTNKALDYGGPIGSFFKTLTGALWGPDI